MKIARRWWAKTTSLTAVVLVVVAGLSAPGVKVDGVSAQSNMPAEFEVIWERPVPWSWLTTPVVMDSGFYLMVEHGKLSELSLEDGRIVRELAPPEPGSYESPAIEGNELYLACGNANVTAFSLPDWETKWSTYTFPPDYTSGCGVHDEHHVSAPCLDGERAYFVCGDRNLYAVARDDGEVIWSFPLEKGGVAAPILFKGLLYTAGYDEVLYGLDPATGRPKWTVPLGEVIEMTVPVVKDGCLFLAGRSGGAFCIDVERRALRWRVQAGSQTRGPVSISDVAFCIGADSGLYCLDPGTGEQLWSKDISVQSTAQADGLVYCHAKEGRFYAIDAKSGQVVAEKQTSHPGFFNQPVVTEDRVLLAARGTIHCFRKPERVQSR